MKTFLEKGGPRTICNEFLHPRKLGFAASLKALRIMKDEFVVAPENELILDVVHPALRRVECEFHGIMSQRDAQR